MNSKRRNLLFILAVAAAVAAVHLLKLGGPDFYPAFALATNMTCIAIVLYYGYRAQKFFHLSSMQGKSALLITLGVLSWGTADLLWTLTGSPAEATYIDLIYFLGYALFGLGILFSLRTVSPRGIGRGRTIVLVIIGLLISSVYFTVLPINWDNTVSVFSNVVNALYVIADLIIILIIFLMLFMVFSGTYAKSMLSLAISSISMLVADIYYLLNSDAYVNGDPIDILWYLGYLLIAVSFVYLVEGAKDALESLRTEKNRDAQRR